MKKVLVAYSANNVAAREFIIGVFKFINEGHDWNVHMLGNPYEITAEDYYFIDMNPSHWAYEICLKATSAYDSEGYVDIITRNSNIRNIIDQYDSQKIY